MLLHFSQFILAVIFFFVQFGNVTCESEEKDHGARFEIVVNDKYGEPMEVDGEDGLIGLPEKKNRVEINVVDETGT